MFCIYIKYTSNEKGIPKHYEFANIYSEGETNLVKKTLLCVGQATQN